MSPLLKRKNGELNDRQRLFRYCLISAAAASGVMLMIFLITGNSLTFGDATVLRMDLYHQYGPLYAELYDRITSGDSLIYSWTSGLGGSFLGNLFNYCSSPFAIFMLLLGHKNMPEAIALMFMFKAALASGSFTYYVNKTNGTLRKESIAFGLMYAFSAYFMAFSWNIMWLDGVAVFPLVMLGIENIINRNKGGLYIFAMTYTMIANYYIAYMVCILSVIYFLIYYFGRYEITSKIFGNKKENSKNEVINEASENECRVYSVDGVIEVSEVTENDSPAEHISDAFTGNDIPVNEEPSPAAVINSSDVKEKKHLIGDKRFWVTGCKFAFASFLCFSLAAFALVPIYFCLQSSSATSGTAPTKFDQYFDIFTFIANHLPGVEPTIRSSGDNVIPNVYCGLLTLFLLPFYFLSDKIPGKQKIVSAILLVVCYSGFVLNILNYIWHGFHMPNDLPYRWSFAYSFFILILAYKAFCNIKEFSNKAYIGMGFAIMVFVVLVQKFAVPNCDDLCLILTVVFTVLYIAVFGMLRSPKYKKNAITGLLFFTIILEIVVVGSTNMVMQQSKEHYTRDYYSFQEIREDVEENDEELIYRTELSKLRTRMDASWYGYNGVSTFSSMAYENTAKIMRKLGVFGNNINSYTYFPQTPVFNSMFNIRYLYDNGRLISDDNYYTYVDGNSDFTAYKYNYYLPVAFAVNDDVLNWDYSHSDPFTVQNNLMSAATGIYDIFEVAPATEFNSENMEYVDVSTINSTTNFTVSKSGKGVEGKAFIKLTPEKDGSYYIFIGTNKNSNMTVTAGELNYVNVNASISSFVLDVGYLTTEDEILVSYTVPASSDTATLTFNAVRINEEKFTEAYNTILANGTMDVTEFNETSFSGTINVKDDNSALWTSIPYDESWEITVDGEVLEYTKTKEVEEEIVVTKDGQIEKIGNGLIGVELDAGEHTVSFRYKAKGLSFGITLTVMGALILVLMIVLSVLSKKKGRKDRLGFIFFRKAEKLEM